MPFRDAVRVWFAISLQTFGGPAGQIAVMHRVLVDEKRWLSEERFLHALNYCMLLPGPEAMQLATFARIFGEAPIKAVWPRWASSRVIAEKRAWISSRRRSARA